MREEFEKMAAAGKLEPRQIEALVRLATNRFCMHRSWGFGEIKTMDPVFGRFTIDFSNKPGHMMELAFAAESLKSISADHILARKASDLEGLRQLAATQRLELIKLVLASFDGRATADQIQNILTPDIIDEDWKKWWEGAKRELKHDGHFLVPLRKSEPIVYQAQEVPLADRLIQEFTAAKGLKARLGVAAEFLKSAPDIDNKQAPAARIVTGINTELANYARTQPAVALEGIFIRDDIRAAVELPGEPGELTPGSIWSQEGRVAELLEAMPSAKHRRALESFQAAHPEDWQERLRDHLNLVSTRLCKEFAGLLIHEGKLDLLKETLARLISQHTASSALLLWLAKERNDSYADILGPEVFRAMLTAMERDQFNEKRSNRLRDYILDDQELLVELIGSADIEVIKDLTRALQYSPSFDDMDKRSLLARIVKSYPAIQSLISGESTRQESYLHVSWESLERRKEEYREMVEKKIPANSREIAIARSYGDLRENHEYKAAKEMQKLLMKQKSELEAQLVRARGTDFAGASADTAGMGTRVQLIDLDTNHPEQFTILGAWDSDPEQGIVSYLSPMAQALIGHKVGDQVEFEVHGVRHHHRLEAIEAFKPASPAEAAAAAPGQATTAGETVS